MSNDKKMCDYSQGRMPCTCNGASTEQCQDCFSAGDMADQGAKAFAARDGEMERLRAERDQLQADLTARDEENDELRNGLVRILQVTSLGEAAFSIACEVLGELDAKALPNDEVQL
ncbi:hypothetical protein [Pseudomonas sp.]|uniref:hypothetical protein n=1 Tax=Pseudomonas sp. TaxID=306 RepID=UPI003D6DBC9D